MNVVFDNNVILDFVTDRHEQFPQAEKLFSLVRDGFINGQVAASSLTDIFFVAAKLTNEKKAKRVIKDLCELLNVLPVTTVDCRVALAMPLDDFEDAVILASAMAAEADCIVTRDRKFLAAKAALPIRSPDNLLEDFA
jgi:predicted nucleic acid-binding protein